MRARPFVKFFYGAIALATLSAAGTPQPEKHYPWDVRPNKCFAPGVPATGMCKAPETWSTFPSSVNYVSSLFIGLDFDLIERAGEEVGLSREKFPTGEYLSEAWYLGIKQTIGGDTRGAKIANDWRASKGDAGFAPFAEALTLYGQAWEARGSGFAGSVSPEGWDLYYKKLDEAFAALTNASPRVKQSGAWQILNLHITYENPKLKPKRLSALNMAAKLWPDSTIVYEVAMYQALPIWGGSFKLTDGVARFAVEKSSKSLGKAMYALLYERVLRDNHFAMPETHANWTMIKEGFRDVDKYHYGQPWIWKNFARMACQMRDKDEAQRLYVMYDKLKTTGTQPDFINDDADACRKFATNRTST